MSIIAERGEASLERIGTPEEVAADVPKVEALIELAEKAIPNMPPY